MAKVSSIISSLQRVSFTVLRLILTLLLFALSPAILTFYSVMLLYRILICKLARHLDPQLGKMVSSISNLFAAHGVYGNSYVTNVALHVAGKIDKFHVINALETLVSVTSPTDGLPLYPELKQKLVRKFGFMFWKNVPDFQIESHVHYYPESDPDTPVSAQDLRDLVGKFGTMPLDSRRSPFDVYIVKNLVNEKDPNEQSVIILRLHHCMFDGYAVLNVLSKLVDNGPLVLAGQPLTLPPSSEKCHMRWLRILVRPLMMILLGPYELVGQLLSFDNNELIQRSRRGIKSEMRFHECEPFSLTELKEVKNHYKVTMSTLVTTIVVGGLMKFMRGRKMSPSKIHMTFPLPILNHPDKLRNNFSGGIISFDMKNSDRVKLLQAVEEKIIRFRFSYAVGLPEMAMFVLRILGSLPCCLVPDLDNVPLSSTLMHSSFPGPVDLGYFRGLPILQATVGGSISKAYPVGTLCFSYCGVYKVALSVDASVLSAEAIEELGSIIQEEFCALQRNVKEAQV